MGKCFSSLPMEQAPKLMLVRTHVRLRVFFFFFGTFDAVTSLTEVHIVIGCDGVKSRVRKLLLGADHPAS